jgi:hypothetical protein
MYAGRWLPRGGGDKSNNSKGSREKKESLRVDGCLERAESGLRATYPGCVARWRTHHEWSVREDTRGFRDLLRQKPSCSYWDGV